jgi:hypothetical protein
MKHYPVCLISLTFIGGDMAGRRADSRTAR